MTLDELIDGEIVEALRPLREYDDENHTAWLEEEYLCFVVTIGGRRFRRHMVKRRLKALLADKVLMCKVLVGRRAWALNEGQYNPENAMPLGV